MCSAKSKGFCNPHLGTAPTQRLNASWGLHPSPLPPAELPYTPEHNSRADFPPTPLLSSPGSALCAMEGQRSAPPRAFTGLLSTEAAMGSRLQSDLQSASITQSSSVPPTASPHTFSLLFPLSDRCKWFCWRSTKRLTAEPQPGADGWHGDDSSPSSGPGTAL